MIHLLDSGIRTENGQFRHAWYRIEQDGNTFFRVAALRELASITTDPQEEIDILGKQWGAVRGLYNAGVDFLYTACGIFNPEHVGIVQMYGAAANSDSEESAARLALTNLGAVEATLAGFPQSGTRTPDLNTIRWYMNFLIRRADHLLALLGHPDPRVKKRGLDLRGGLPDQSNDDLAAEQNEILFRGLAKMRHDFVFQVTSEHIGRGVLVDSLMKVAQIASDMASRQKGTKSVGFTLGIPILASLNSGVSGSTSRADGHTTSQTDGVSKGWGQSYQESRSHTDGRSTSFTHSETTGESTNQTVSHSDSVGQSSTDGSGSSWSDGKSASMGQSVNFGGSVLFLNGGGGYNIIQGVSHMEGGSSFSSETNSSGSTDGVANGTGSFHSVTDSSTSTKSQSDTTGQAHGINENWGQSHQVGQSDSAVIGRSGSQMMGGGISAGLAPSINLTQSWMTEDDVAIRLTEILRGLEAQLNQASAEGGFMTDALLFTSNTQSALEAAALVPQAFHGPSVPTPVMTIAPDPLDARQLRDCATVFMPCPIHNPDDPFDGLLWTKYSTLLTAGQVAAYTSPGLLQEGGVKIIAPIPREMGFYPRMSGEVMLGHQFSPSTRLLTRAKVMLDKPRLMHTLFAGNTGFGKSVAAMRMSYEIALQWGMRVVVLDFGFSWRMLLNAPGLENRVDIRQLRPDGVRPLRWNPMQIGTFINPETQLRAFADLFGTIGQLGQKQQQHRLLDASRTIYLRAGVLVDDPEVRSNPTWGKVSGEEALLFGFQAGSLLSALDPDQRQKLSVHRSSRVGLMDLYKEVNRQINELPPRDIVGRGVLEGILWRLKSLVNGGAAAQFAPATPSSPTTPVEDLGRPNQVVILEGGKFLDTFSKAWLLGWAGWMIYSDMVSRRERQLNKGEADLFMVYEEANIIFSGLEREDPEQKSGQNVSEQHSNMFRDARKYGAFFGVVTQSPSLIPPGIRNSCNNLVVTYLSDTKDKDAILSALARSEKGFHDEPWRRFLADLRIGMCIGRLPYSFEREQQLPFLFEPLMLNVSEPGDLEIEKRLGRIKL